MSENENKKKRGMPKEHKAYPEEIFLNKLSYEFKTTGDILKELNSNENLRNFSWNTVQRYLSLLSKEGKVEYKKEGKFNFWRKISEEREDGKPKQV